VSSPVWVWTCTGTRGQYTNLQGTTSPSCTPASSAAWVEAENTQTAWTPADLEVTQLQAAFAAGFIVMGTGLVIAWAARFVLQAIREALQ
jgi:hypothetical protein